MKVGDMFPSKYLSGADLVGKQVVVTIAAVRAEKMRDPHSNEDINKWVIYFDGKNKGLVLNKTLAGQISKALSTDETTLWTGKRIQLYPEAIKVAGEDHIAVRARAAQAAADPVK
jgi:hypothetical protein